jgi:hypothetical protein
MKMMMQLMIMVYEHDTLCIGMAGGIAWHGSITGIDNAR